MLPERESYQVFISQAANDRMYDHFEFLARVNEVAAERLLVDLVADIHSLAEMPHRNPAYDRPYLKEGKYRYMVSCSRYRLVYQIVKNTVFLEDIQDCRQSEDSSLVST